MNFLQINWYVWLQGAIITTVCSVALLLGMGAFLCHHSPLDFSVLEQYDPGKPSLILDDEGNEWARFQVDRRLPVPLSKMPSHLINAFIAAEDWHFFTHSGISFKGIIRSLLVNLYYGKFAQGASTITQQLVKLLFFDMKKTVTRKIKEQVYSILVERQFTKEQILEMYLNHVCFGCGIYGVEAAAQRFWNKSVCDLTIEESAVLAAIVRSPTNYCPLSYPLSSERRRNVVLGQMLKLKFITQDYYQKAKLQPVGLIEAKNELLAPHFKEALRKKLEELFGKQQLYSGGLSIKTTLNQKAQRAAQNAFTKQFIKLKKELGKDIEGGFISIDVKTGAIRAMIGGSSFGNSQFNRALQARRQQGSVFKPLLYAAALQEGMSFLDTAIDEPLIVQQAGAAVWEPKNHTREFEGSMTLARALSYSNNIISAKVILAIGPQKVANLAKKCHLGDAIEPYPSLALGCVDSTVYEVAGMFNIFANEGYYVQPFMVEWVKDLSGKKIYRCPVEKECVLPSRIVSQVAQVLSFGLERKRSFAKEWLDSTAIGKTGTTNDSRTCWFAGSTPELTTVAYVGFDDNRSMGSDIYPVYTTYPVWLAYHQQIPTKTKQFLSDPTLKEVFVNIKTGSFSSSSSSADEDVFPLLL